MPRRLRILSVTSQLPLPPVGGTKILVFRQVDEMARHHDVDLIAVDVDDGRAHDRKPLAHCRSITMVPIPETERRFSLREKVALTASTGYPFYVYQRHSEAAQRLIDARLASGDYDVVIAEDGEAGVYVRAEHPCFKMLSKHAIMSVQRDQLAGIATSPFRRTIDRTYAALARRYERDEATRFDLVKLPTRDDVLRWRAIVGSRADAAFAVSNGVDASYFEYRDRRGPVDRLIFTANLAGPQNADAAEWFMTQVYPRVAEQTALPLYVVGHSPPARIIEKATDRITVTGSVPDVRPFYGEKAVAIVPLRVASGIINKVLEPMAMGVAVVASSLAVAGLDIEPERICLVADGEDAFARAVVRLATDEALYEKLTRAAHEYVRSHHAWPSLLTRYRERIEAAIGLCAA